MNDSSSNIVLFDSFDFVLIESAVSARMLKMRKNRHFSPETFTLEFHRSAWLSIIIGIVLLTRHKTILY